MKNIATSKKALITSKVSTLLVISITLITACGFNTIPADKISARELAFPKLNYYRSLVNKDNDVIALTEGENLIFYRYAKEGDQVLSSLEFSNDSNCVTTKYYPDTPLPNGQLQVWKDCGSGGNGTRRYLLAYDWESGKLQELTGLLPLGSSGASWNPDQTKAIGYLDSGFASRTLFWIDKDGFAPLDLVISDKNHSWNLKDDFPDFKADDTGKSGSTGRAAWSPDGNQIAFFASPDAVGKTGFSKFGVEYNLYLMNSETLIPMDVTDNIHSPFLINWSSDSKNIAFIGKYGFLKENGIWVYSLETDEITQVSLGEYKDIVWRPNKNILVAIECENYDLCNKIIEFDLTNVLETYNTP